MLKKRIIPILLYKNNMLVKSKQFNNYRVIGSVLPTIKIFNNRQVDELIFLDIDANKTNKINYDLISDISKYCNFPFTVGGGIKTLEDISLLLQNGADKVSINTSVYNDLQFIRNAVQKFGSQCIIVSIDVQKVDNKYICFNKSGTNNVGYNLIDWLKQINDLNVGELLVTSIDNDGMMNGYDKDLINIIQENINIPIIISGGCGSYLDMYEVFNRFDISAIGVSSLFHFTESTPKNAKLFLSEKGINVRHVLN
jgi:cyclase